MLIIYFIGVITHEFSLVANLFAHPIISMDTTILLIGMVICSKLQNLLGAQIQKLCLTFN